MQTIHTVKAVASSLAANAAIALALGLSLSPAAYAGDFGEGYPLFLPTQAKPVQAQTKALTPQQGRQATVALRTDFENNYPQYAESQARAQIRAQAQRLAQRQANGGRAEDRRATATTAKASPDTSSR